MRPVLLAVLLCSLSSCSGVFHRSSPDLDLKLEERPWRVRCGWYLPPRPEADALANPSVSGASWASDSARRRLILDGRVEEGFYIVERVRAASDVDDRDIEQYPATAMALRQACATSIKDAPEDARPRVYSVMAARDGEDVDVPMVVPDDAASPRPVSRIVVFGDSLSDTGNLKQRLLIFPRSPYWLGRFSNGPNWTDYLSERTGITVQNHAYGGAVAAKHDDVPAEGVVAAIEKGGQYFLTGSIVHQVTDYLDRDLRGGIVRAPREVVFVIWAGSIDYMVKEPFTGEISTLLDSPGSEAGYRKVARETVASIAEQISRLHAAGARQFVIINLPDMGKSPIILQNKSYMSGRAITDAERRLLLSRKLTELTTYHNAELARAIATLARGLPDVKLLTMDSADLMDRIFAGRAPGDEKNKFDYGFALRELEQELRHGGRSAHFQRHCYSGGYLGSDDPSTVCAESQTAMFWDVVHPTSYTHCWLAFGVQRTLAKAGLAGTLPNLEQQRAYCTARTQPTW